MMRFIFPFLFLLSVQCLHGQSFFLPKAMVDSFRVKTFTAYEGTGDERRLISRTTYDTSGKTTSMYRVYYSDSTTRFYRDSFITRGDVFVVWHIAGSQMDSSVTTCRTENGWRMMTTESYQDGTIFMRELYLSDSTKSVRMTERLGNNFYCLIMRSQKTYDERGRITSNEWTDSLVSPKVRWQVEHKRHEYEYDDQQTVERYYSEQKGKLRLNEVSYSSTVSGKDSVVYYDRKGKVNWIVIIHTDSLRRDTLVERRTRKGKLVSQTSTEYLRDRTIVRSFTTEKGLVHILTYYYENNGLCTVEIRQEGETGEATHIYYEYEFY